MDRTRGRHHLVLFLAAAAIVGGLTFVSARPASGGAALDDAAVRRALLEAVSMGAATAAGVTAYRRRWKNVAVIVLLGAGAALWGYAAPPGALRPTGTALFALAYIGVPLATAFGFWRRRRR
jgi:hypothetical protein